MSDWFLVSKMVPSFIYWLCLVTNWINTSQAVKITNFTIGAVLNDDRHDTLFREAITVSDNPSTFLIFQLNFEFIFNCHFVYRN